MLSVDMWVAFKPSKIDNNLFVWVNFNDLTATSLGIMVN